MASLIDRAEEFATMAREFLEPHNLTLGDIKTGRDAWQIAHRSVISRIAYDTSRDITDAHIVTVLRRIMPNAVFADKYHY